MHHNVGAEPKRPRQIRRGKSIVDEERHASGTRDVCDLRNIEHFKPGIADSLGDDKASFRSDRRTEAVEIARLDEGRGDAEAGQRVGQEIDRAAIERS